jgi:thiol:disulfide interchange protein DsbC
MRAFALFFVAFLLAAPAQADKPDLDKLKTRLQLALPGVHVDEIRPAPLPGLYELVVGTDIVYLSADGKYMVMGDIIDIDARSNLSDRHRDKLVLKAVNGIGEDKMIVIGDPNAKHSITVFTDVDCPYCAKLHQEVPQLTAAGVKVRYLLFPRNGLKSETYKRSVAVWCAADRVKAIGIAKGGGAIEMKECPNPVAEIYNFGRKLGIRGTPAIVLDDGRIIPGYSPARRLLALLGVKDTMQTSSKGSSPATPATAAAAK